MRPEVRPALPPGLSRSMQMRALLFRKKALGMILFFPFSFLRSGPGTRTQSAAGAAAPVIFGVRSQPEPCPGSPAPVILGVRSQPEPCPGSPAAPEGCSRQGTEPGFTPGVLVAALSPLPLSGFMWHP